jgi:methionine synthase I (cobalamin-dependent)
MSVSNPLADLLAEKGVLLADGATGTNLFAMGLESGDAPELWNESAQHKITKLHQDFVDAGSDIILTNSFGGTRNRLKLHHAQDRVHELNKKAGEIARAVADKADRARSSSRARLARQAIFWCRSAPLPMTKPLPPLLSRSKA